MRYKTEKRLQVETLPFGRQTAYGGLILIDGILQKFGVWKKFATEPDFHIHLRRKAHKRRESAHAPRLLAAQCIFTLASGGKTWDDMEAIFDPSSSVLRKAIGLGANAVAPREALQEWLDGLPVSAVAKIRAMNTALISGITVAAPPSRLLDSHDAWRLAYEDLPTIVEGSDIEPSMIHNLWGQCQTIYAFWQGPLLLEMGAGSDNKHVPYQPSMLRTYASLRGDKKVRFFARGYAFTGPHLADFSPAGIDAWSVCCRAWNKTLVKPAARLPHQTWRTADGAHAGEAEREAFNSLRIPMEGLCNPQLFAVVRHQDPHTENAFAFIAHGYGLGQTPAEVFRLTREAWRAPNAPEPLRLLTPHTLPCNTRNGNNAFFALATLAYNSIFALKVLDLPDACQTWPMDAIIKECIILPAAKVSHSNRHHFRLDSGSVTRQTWWAAAVEKWCVSAR